MSFSSIIIVHISYLQNGRTPLHDACLHQKTAICKLLIDKGASVTLTDVVSSKKLRGIVTDSDIFYDEN